MIPISTKSSKKVYMEINKLENPTTADYISNFTTQQWAALMEVAPELTGVLSELLQQKSNYEYFLVNLVDAPSQLVASGNYLAFIVPILAGASTFIFSKITMAQSRPATPTPAGQENPAESVAKTMNIMMPIMMGAFSYTVPSGLALYWIAGNLIMMGQQVLVGRVVSKEMAAFDEQLERERAEKAAPKKKRKKRPAEGAENNPDANNKNNSTNNSGANNKNNSANNFGAKAQPNKNNSQGDKPRKERKQPGK